MSPFRKASPSTRGFSLVELLVALVFISLLMAGMLRVYGSAIQGFATANETIKAQRDNRWALQALQDDLQSAGYFFPVRPVIGGIDNVNAGNQNPLMVLPGRTVTNKFIADPNNPAAAPSDETLTFDEFQFVTDQLLPISARLAATPSDPNSITITATLGDLSLVRAGDFAVILDPAHEVVTVGGGPYSGTTASIALNAAAIQDQSTGAFLGAFGNLKSLTHQAGAEVMFIRPNQVVRYSILPMALDPSNAAVTVPCLVRDQTAYPIGGALIAWPAADATQAALATAGPGGAPVVRGVVAENVTGLRFDLSANQGQAWTRAGTWADTLTNLNGQLAALATANPGIGYATSAQDPSNPLWYRTAPLLIRADLTTRTLVRRAEYANTANTLAYRTRTQTAFIQPRNFGFGL